MRWSLDPRHTQRRTRWPGPSPAPCDSALTHSAIFMDRCVDLLQRVALSGVRPGGHIASCTHSLSHRSLCPFNSTRPPLPSPSAARSGSPRRATCGGSPGRSRRAAAPAPQPAENVPRASPVLIISVREGGFCDIANRPARRSLRSFFLTVALCATFQRINGSVVCCMHLGEDGILGRGHHRRLWGRAAAHSERPARTGASVWARVRA